MGAENSPSSSSLSPPRRQVWLCALILIVATLVAYANSFKGVFLLDDQSAINDNPSIRSLSPLSAVLSPPERATVGGRPLANLSFAINYAISGLSPWSYHAVNLAIHLAAGLLLFGVVRRTLQQRTARSPLGARAAGAVEDSQGERRFADPVVSTWLAACVAGLWLVHPLTTETVTYISQRTEAMMAVGYLATLYAFIRGAETDSWVWLAVSVASCAAGMACKEVIVTAPFVVALYDRVFLAPTWSEVWRRRWKYHLALAATWLWLGWLMRGGIGHHSVGYGLGVTAWAYALSECEAVVRYAGLAVWPHPLIFDYGPVSTPLARAVPFAAILLVLLAATGWTLARRPMAGVAAACFFIVLAPTSSVIPLAEQPISENRAYLPAALVVTLLVTGCHALLGRRARWLLPVVALGAIGGTLARNELYRSAASIWAETVARRPESQRALNNLAIEYFVKHDYAATIEYCRQVLRLHPRYVESRINLASALLALRRFDEAHAEIETAIREFPAFAPPRFVYGHLLFQQQQYAAAVEAFQKALELRPDYDEAHAMLGAALINLRRPAEALSHLDRALAFRPGYPDARNLRCRALLLLHRVDEAVAEGRDFVRNNPDSADAHAALAGALDDARHADEARREFEVAVRLDPANASIRARYGVTLLHGKQAEAAQAQELEALRLDPELPFAHSMLAAALIDLRRPAEGELEAREALRLDSNLSDAHYNLGTALIDLGRPAEAIPEFEAELLLSPDSVNSLNNLAGALFCLGRFTEAIARYEDCLRLHPDDLGSRQNLASALFQAGRREEALETYRAVLARQPDQLDARRNLAVTLAIMGRSAEALAEFEAVLRLKPDDSTALDGVARFRPRP